MNSETRKSMIASTLGIRLAFMVKSSPLLENGANNLLYRLPPPPDAGISPRRDPIDRVRLIAGLAHHGAEADAVNRVPTRGAISPHHQLMCIAWPTTAVNRTRSIASPQREGCPTLRVNVHNLAPTMPRQSARNCLLSDDRKEQRARQVVLPAHTTRRGSPSSGIVTR